MGHVDEGPFYSPPQMTAWPSEEEPAPPGSWAPFEREQAENEAPKLRKPREKLAYATQTAVAGSAAGSYHLENICLPGNRWSWYDLPMDLRSAPRRMPGFLR